MRQPKMEEFGVKMSLVTQKKRFFITLGETKWNFWSTMCAAFQQSNFYYGKYDY